MSEEMKIEITTIPSHYVIKVIEDPETGGYEVIADLRKIKAKWQSEARHSLLSDLKSIVKNHKKNPTVNCDGYKRACNDLLTELEKIKEEV